MTRALLVLLVAVLAAAQPARADAAAFVRVDQAGYEAGAPARAYVMATTAVSGTFSVLDRTQNVISQNPIGPRLGTWSHSAKRRYRVYALDFAVPAGDGYTIAVANARSPAFSVGAPASLYGPLLGNARFYYDSVRDGPDFVKGPLSPKPAHLNDAHARTYFNPPIERGGDERLTTHGRPLKRYGPAIDASGGHWDAGDNLKYVETESYTAALMEIGLRDFPGQLGPGAPVVTARSGTTTPDFTDQVRFSLDFLLRMWDDAHRVLYFQVGNTQSWKHFPKLRADYDFWRLPQADDTVRDDRDDDYRFIRRRPVFVAGPPGSTRDPAGKPISPNLAGRLAAAFALYAQLGHPEALQAAEHVFAQADRSYPDPATDRRRLLTIIPFDGYPETVWDDDMELGATELYLATGEPRYLTAARHFATRYDALPAADKDTLNLYDVSGLAHYELARADPARRQTLIAELTAQVHKAEAHKDAFGFGRDWRAGDTTSHGDGLAVMAAEVGDPSAARTWLGNMLGANPWGVSLIIGAGTTWTNCPQQQPANLLGSLTGGAPELWGAAVEGPTDAAVSGGYDTMRACPPDKRDAFAPFNGNDGAFERSERAVYRDNVESYTTTEPAIDLTATSFLAFAWRIAQQPAPLAARQRGA